MNIFVKSRGLEQQEDYQWHYVTDKQEIIIDALAPAPYGRYGLGHMISAEHESYVLGRFENNLELLITSVPSPIRRDFIGRPIRDSLLWEGSSADEALLRGIIAHALNNAKWLPAILDKGISFDKHQRFKVQQDVFTAVLDQIEVACAWPDPVPRIRRLTEASRQELGNELHATMLPRGQGLLVVVTTVQSLQKMVDVGIWRGLAQGIRSERGWFS